MRRYSLLLGPVVIALATIIGGCEPPGEQPIGEAPKDTPVAAASPVERAAPVPAPKSGAIAITGALIHTQTDAGSFVGTIVIDGGKVVALGKDVTAPAGAHVIDGAGHVVTPGLIDAHGILWLQAAAAKEGGSAGTLNILDAVDPYADEWRDAAAQGVTAVYVQPAAGSFAGNGAVLRVGPAKSIEDLATKPVAGMQASIASAAPAAGPQGTAPASGNSISRAAAAEGLRGQLLGAKNGAAGKGPPAKKDAARDLLTKVVKKEIPLRLAVSHEDDVRNALKFSAELGIRPVFEGLDKVRTVPDGRFAAVLGPFPSAKKAQLRKLIVEGDKPFALGTFGDDARATAGLRLQAAAAVAEGYPRDKVLRALTRGAAELVGVEDKLGSLTVGRVADLAVFAGDPLDASVPARLVISQGTIVHDATADAEPASPHGDGLKLPATFPPSFVLKTKRLLADSGEYVPGELTIENGKITAPSSANLPVIDVGDAVVTPGLVVAHAATAGGNTADPEASHVRATDGVAPDSANMKAYREAGFLTVIAAPAADNTIGGVIGVVKLGDGGMTVAADAGQKFTLTATARQVERYPATLGGQVEFIDARLKGLPAVTNMFLPEPVERMILAQRDKALEPVKSGKHAAVFEVGNRAEVAAALRLITDHKLRGVLVGPRQINEMAFEIKTARAGVIVTPVKPSDADYVRTGLVELGKAGVPLAFGSGTATELRSTAAWLVNGGLGRHDARRALAGRGSEALGLPANTGRLAAGDAADFVVWDGCPLDPSSQPLAVVAQGKKLGKK
ncbi:MAG: amidohydrolase family protein [Gemmataceae bacterium]